MNEPVLQYAIHGLVLSSDVPLPISQIGRGEHDADIEFSSRPPQPSFDEQVVHRRVDDVDEPMIVERWLSNGRISVEFFGAAVFQFDERTAHLVDDRRSDAALIAHLLIDHVVPRMVSMRGDLMLHASGVVGPSGRAHLFLGHAGAGKSTLATYLALHGWQLLDDDSVRVLDSSGVDLAMPGYDGVRLLPLSVAALFHNDPGGEPMASGNPKLRFDVADVGVSYTTQGAPLAAVHQLENDSTTSTLSVERLSFGESIGALVEHGFNMGPSPVETARKAFDLSSRVASRVMVTRFARPRGFDHLEATAVALERFDAELAAAAGS